MEDEKESAKENETGGTENDSAGTEKNDCAKERERKFENEIPNIEHQLFWKEVSVKKLSGTLWEIHQKHIFLLKK